MKIIDVQVHTLQGSGSQGAFGAPFATLVEVSTDEGITGWGEVDNHPTMTRAVIEGEFHHEMMSGLATVVCGEDPTEPTAIWEKMQLALTNVGHGGLTNAAMAGIDIALWDIKAKYAQKPLYEVLGGAKRTELSYYATYPLGATIDETRVIASQAASTASPAFKFGWTPFGMGSHADNEAIVAALRESIGENKKLLLDGGLAFDVESALQCAAMLARHDVYWFEEPLRPYDLGGYRELRRRSPIPITAGEMAVGEHELMNLIDAECVDVLQIDLTRVGITKALTVAEHAAERGIRCVNHTYTQDVNLAASAHFIAAAQSVDLFEVQQTPNEIRDVLVSNRLRIDSGYVSVPDRLGHGVEPNPEMLRRFETGR